MSRLFKLPDSSISSLALKELFLASLLFMHQLNGDHPSDKELASVLLLSMCSLSIVIPALMRVRDTEAAKVAHLML